MLREKGSVRTTVRCTDVGLLTGSIDGVTVRGEGWCSPLGLRCREIEATVSATGIDAAQVLARRRIVLVNRPRGTARVSFTAADFGSFLTHPLLAGQCVVGGEPFVFGGDGVDVSPAGAGGARVSLRGTWRGRPYRCALVSRGDGSVACEAAEKGAGGGGAGGGGGGGGGAGGERAQAVARGLARFFGTVTVDLQGVELQFAGMRARGGLLDLSLRLRVREFPPLDVRF